MYLYFVFVFVPAESHGSPEWRVIPPRVYVTPIDKKTERCERQVPKLLMRGEHVIHIQPLG